MIRFEEMNQTSVEDPKDQLAGRFKEYTEKEKFTPEQVIAKLLNAATPIRTVNYAYREVTPVVYNSGNGRRMVAIDGGDSGSTLGAASLEIAVVNAVKIGESVSEGVEDQYLALYPHFRDKDKPLGITEITMLIFDKSQIEYIKQALSNS